MKLSLKLQDQENHHHHHLHTPPLLLRAKIPITIFNLPFLSHLTTTTNTTTHPNDLSLALSTNFTTGPSLKLSYSATTTAATPPLTLSLKSGTGIFGSPKDSPLIISANFSFNPSNPSNSNPTFSLMLKPQLGSFSLQKRIFSQDSTTGQVGSEASEFVPLERKSEGDVKGVFEEKIGKDSIFRGVRLAARTLVPVGRRVEVGFRWWVDFSGNDVPVLRINKIGVERVEDGVVVKKENDDEKKKGEVEMLKGMCFWMKRELDGLVRVNKEMKCELEEMRLRGIVGRSGGGGGVRDFGEGVVQPKKGMPAVVERPSSGGFEQWRSNKRNGGGEENGKKDEKKKGSVAMDVEDELQRAIKAAAAVSQ